jgi:hypothetical protein
MTKEEYDLIRRFARKYLFRKYHSRYLCDLTQYLCMKRFENPKVDLRYAMLDFCRIESITIDQHTRVGAMAVAHGGEILIEPSIPEQFDPFGVIEEKLLEKGIEQRRINEALNLLIDKDYSGALSCFRRIGFDLPCKYKYQRWENGEKLYKLANKIVKYLRENLC